MGYVKWIIFVSRGFFDYPQLFLDKSNFMSLTSTSVPPSVTSDTCPYFPSSVPYYLATVVQPYSENLAIFSFNCVYNYINGIINN